MQRDLGDIVLNGRDERFAHSFPSPDSDILNQTQITASTNNDDRKKEDNETHISFVWGSQEALSWLLSLNHFRAFSLPFAEMDRPLCWLIVTTEELLGWYFMPIVPKL